MATPYDTNTLRALADDSDTGFDQQILATKIGSPRRFITHDIPSNAGSIPEPADIFAHWATELRHESKSSQC